MALIHRAWHGEPCVDSGQGGAGRDRYRSRDLEWGSLGDGGYWWSTRRWRDCELRYLGPDEEGRSGSRCWGSSLYELLSKTDDPGLILRHGSAALSGREPEGPSLADFRHARRLSRSHS